MRTSAATRKAKNRWILMITTAVLVMMSIGFGSIFVNRTLFSDKNWRTNIIFHTQPPVLLSYPPNKADKVLLFILPENLSLTVPYGYGIYRSDAVWKLSELESNPALVRDTYTDLFGVPVQGIIGATLEQAVVYDPVHQASDLGRMIQLGEGSSFLKLSEQLKLMIDLKFLSARRLLVYDVRNQPLYDTMTLPGGSEVFQVNPNRWDNFLSQKFEESKIREEALTVTILNSTATSGLGQKFARFVSAIGGKVLKVANETSDIKTCQLRVGETNRQKLLIRFLSSEFGCALASLSETNEVDLVVIVGESFAKRWLKNE